MTTYTVLVLLFAWGVQPWVWIALAFCILLGAWIEALALTRCKRWGRWFFPLLLAAIWLAAELVGGFSVNYVQLAALFLLAVSLACLLGALLGFLFYYIEKNRRED